MPSKKNLRNQNPPNLDKITKPVESNRYAAVAVVAKRARQITARASGEGSEYQDITPPQVNIESDNSVSIAMEELAEAKLLITYPKRHKGPEV